MQEPLQEFLELHQKKKSGSAAEVQDRVYELVKELIDMRNDPANDIRNGGVVKGAVKFRRFSKVLRFECSSNMAFESAFRKILEGYDFDLDHRYEARLPCGKKVKDSACWAFKRGGAPLFPDPDEAETAVSGAERLGSLVKIGESIKVLFDFGDGWEIRIAFQEKVDADKGDDYFLVTSAKGQGPKQYH